jgi:flagellar hook-basal body complex protein FliE
MAIRIGGPQSLPVPSVQPSSAKPDGAAKAFGDFLAEALAGVGESQREAADASKRLASGQIQDVAEVMIASEKATVSLQLAMQVRNKLVEAYQEIMRMPM